jgi:F-type H+-transporting ATPase subunit epsilon
MFRGRLTTFNGYAIFHWCFEFPIYNGFTSSCRRSVPVRKARKLIRETIVVFSSSLMSFQCTLVTPETQLFSETITAATLPAHDGLVGILTGRAPVLLKIGSGPLTLSRSSGAAATYFISGGVAQMKDNQLTILTDEAVKPESLDVEAARKELETLAKPEVVTTAVADARRRRADRAHAVLRMAGQSA